MADRAPLLGHRYAGRVVLAVALALPIFAISIGFTCDDYGFVNALRSGLRRSFDLFRFGPGNAHEMAGLIDAGVFPWWTAPDFKLHFFRPLTSLLFTADVALFQEHALGYHLTSIALYFALLFAVSRLLRHVLPLATANLALLIFGLRGAHALPYSWICAQHMLVGVTPAVFALLAYVMSEKEGWRPGRLLAPALFVVALAGSEIALGIVPLWVAFIASQARSSRDWKRGLRECAAPVGIVAVYLVVYRLADCGTRSALDYIDPFTQPLAVVRAAAVRLPALYGDAILAIPADPRTANVTRALLGLGGLGLCSALAFTNRAVTAEERSALTWLVPGAVFSVFLGGASGAARLLVVPDIGFGALLAVVVRHGFTQIGEGAARRAGRVVATAVLALASFVVSPLLGARLIGGLAHVSRTDEHTAAEAELGATAGQRVFVMPSADPDVYFYPKEIIAVRSPGALGCWSPVSATTGPHRLLRRSDRSFVVELLGAPQGDGYGGLYFGVRQFAEGDAVHQCGAWIRTEELRDGVPSRIRVDLDEPLESPDVTLLVWDHEQLRRVALPPTGGSVELPWIAPAAAGRRAGLVARVLKRLLH